MANDTVKPVTGKRGYAPTTPTAGYEFGEHRCATAKCRADHHLFKYEISVGHAPFRVKSNHVRCDRCDQLYELTVTEDSEGHRISARPFVD